MSKNEITYRVWAKRGNMLVNTECLSIEDPEHPYNQVKAQGVRPEDFGMQHPLAIRFDGKNRAELIGMILEFENELNFKAIYGDGK